MGVKKGEFYKGIDRVKSLEIFFSETISQTICSLFGKTIWQDRIKFAQFMTREENEATIRRGSWIIWLILKKNLKGYSKWIYMHFKCKHLDICRYFIVRLWPGKNSWAWQWIQGMMEIYINRWSFLSCWAWSFAQHVIWLWNRPGTKGDKSWACGLR